MEEQQQDRDGDVAMADNLAGKLRRSAVVMTYAPGAIVDMRAEGAPVSGVAAGLEEWDRSAPMTGDLKNQKIVERRLCRKLGKKYFRLPPVLDDDAKKDDGTPDNRALVIRRFPEWLQCPFCEILKPAYRWAMNPGRAYRYCAECTAKQPGWSRVYAIPVRFAVACMAGHIDEFPWSWWVPHTEKCKKPDRYKLSSVGPGLSGLVVSCIECGGKRSLDGAFRENALSGLQCRGHRPWLRENSTSCDCAGAEGRYRVVQRGASNLYYPVIESALDIPPWTRQLEQVIGDYWDDLASIVDRNQRTEWIERTPYLMEVVRQLKITAGELSRRFDILVEELDAADLRDLRTDEYRVFVSGVEEQPGSEFEIRQQQVPPGLEGLIERVVRAARLREVRVVKGFTRINPPLDPDGSDISPLSVSSLDWLPGIEVRGEGIFLQLNTEAIERWEQQSSVQARTVTARESWRQEWMQRNPDRPLPYEASPRLLMVHALSHALIRQLTLECGYSSASLRERLYVKEGHDSMAGILIYTATSDSDGTLGGLQRRAIPSLLGPSVTSAIRTMQWCSSDPLCISGEMSAPYDHSVASCHSCLMVSETSCELHNRLLDRALLVGTETDPGAGFFSPLLRGIA